MALYWHVPGFTSYRTDKREGDTQWFRDYKKLSNGKVRNNFLVIDGGTPTYFDLLLKDLKLFKANEEGSETRCLITHAHYDHYKGIRLLLAHKTSGKYTFNITTLYCYDPESLRSGLRDNKGSGYVKSEINTLKAIIEEAKARGVKVVYLKNKQKVTWGDIKFQAFREQPSKVANDDKYGDCYLNDGSICTWFWELKYLTTGDGPERIDKLCEKYGLDTVFVKGPHHGNNFIRVCATWMKKHGCLYYWDNDLSKGITDFLQTGREDAIGVGMKVLNVIGDINGLFFSNKAYIYHEGKLAFSYNTDYAGEKTITQKTPASLTRKILRGTYGNGDRRITNVIALNYAPAEAQKNVNKVISLANDIKSGKVDYGRNEERLKKIDGELGKGYGQLVQDYINVLYGLRKAV